MRSTSCPPDETLSAMSSVKEQQKIIGVSNNNDSMHGIPDVGPFLSVLLTKLENMMHNTIYVNLQLTGLISRLAMYPQPLLRSFLLSHNIVFQPTVRSLFQVLGSLKHKLDTFASSESSFSDMLRRARSFLAAREEKRLHELSPSRRSIQENRGRGQTVIMADAAHHRGEVRRRSLTNFLFRRGTFHDEKEQSVREVELESIAEGQGYRYINKRSPDAPEEKLEWLKTKNAVLCAIVVEEFVKELASISQEHHIVDVDTFDFLSI
ncbi:FAM160A1 (predicted) [Pycnogonum litorale]